MPEKRIRGVRLTREERLEVRSAITQLVLAVIVHHTNRLHRQGDVEMLRGLGVVNQAEAA